MKIKYSYKNISDDIQNQETANLYLSKQAILDRMLDSLPPTPWANMEILDWLPHDDRLPIKYSFYQTPFGEVLVANTPKGVCYLGLIERETENILADFKKRFKHADPIKRDTPLQKQAIDFLEGKTSKLLSFHLRGTPYQTEIWRKLIRIPYGKVISYATLGGGTQHSRAAGTANGRNPIFWIVPCQRAVKTTGGFDRYFWGEDVKKKLLAWEFANTAI